MRSTYVWSNICRHAEQNNKEKRTHTIDVLKTFFFFFFVFLIIEAKNCFWKSNQLQKAIEIGAIKFRLRFTFFHCPFTNEEINMHVLCTSSCMLLLFLYFFLSKESKKKASKCTIQLQLKHVYISETMAWKIWWGKNTSFESGYWEVENQHVVYGTQNIHTIQYTVK